MTSRLSRPTCPRSRRSNCARPSLKSSTGATSLQSGHSQITALQRRGSGATQRRTHPISAARSPRRAAERGGASSPRLQDKQSLAAPALLLLFLAPLLLGVYFLLQLV